MSDSHAWSIDLNALRRGEGSFIDFWARSSISASGRGEGILEISVLRAFGICWNGNCWMVSFLFCWPARGGFSIVAIGGGLNFELGISILESAVR